METVPRFPKWLQGGLIVFALVLLASLFGILTRPLNFLAAFWPANALLLGVLVRFSRLAHPASWVGATLGYFTADLVTGGEILATAWLTAGNLAGVVTGWVLFRLRSKQDILLHHPLSVLRLFAICVAAAFAAACVGSGSAPIIFGKSWAEGFWFWFATELVNSIVILPVIFTMPAESKGDSAFGLMPRGQIRWQELFPIAFLLISVVAGFLVGGPGAIAFPITALLWCALTYSLFGSALLNLFLCMWLMIGISAGILHVPLESDFMQSMTSLRLGITLLALGPLTVASMNKVKSDLLDKLQFVADHDSLTGALSRKAFLERGELQLAEGSGAKRPIAVLMIDIDGFKMINDEFGHGAGDRILAQFVTLSSQVVGADGFVGRLGGDEFGVILPDSTREEASEAASRIVHEIRSCLFSTQGDVPISLTVSVGVVIARERESLAAIMSRADRALYQAKEGGRDRVVCG